MRKIALLAALAVLIPLVMVATPPVAVAAGVGVCVAGNGVAIDDPAHEGPFIGANAGSYTGVYDQQQPTEDEMTAYYKDAGAGDDGWPADFAGAASFEGQCCRETADPPDCFGDI